MTAEVPGGRAGRASRLTRSDGAPRRQPASVRAMGASEIRRVGSRFVCAPRYPWPCYMDGYLYEQRSGIHASMQSAGSGKRLPRRDVANIRDLESTPMLETKLAGRRLPDLPRWMHDRWRPSHLPLEGECLAPGKDPLASRSPKPDLKVQHRHAASLRAITASSRTAGKGQEPEERSATPPPHSSMLPPAMPSI